MANDEIGNLDKIEHIVVLMMENRSFDHMLGFFAIDEGRPKEAKGSGLKAGGSEVSP